MRKAAKHWLVLVVLPLAAASAWYQFSAPSADADPVQRAEMARQKAVTAAATLAHELEQKPDNPIAWVALARAYGALGRWDDAASAFGRVGPTLDAHPDWLAAAAEVNYHRAGQRFTETSRALVQKALQRDPRQVHALTLHASDAMQREDWPAAHQRWAALLDVLPPASNDAAEVKRTLEQVRSRIKPN